MVVYLSNLVIPVSTYIHLSMVACKVVLVAVEVLILECSRRVFMFIIVYLIYTLLMTLYIYI